MRAWGAAVLTCIAAGIAAPAAAQRIELTPFVGYRVGGEIGKSGEQAALEVKESGAWGVSLGVKVSEEGELEALFARQDTRLASAGFFTSQPRFDLAVEIYQFAGNYLFGDDKARFRPYVSAGFGATRLVPEPPQLESETRFSASFGAGVKAYLGAHFGVRAEVRGFFTVLDSDSAALCDSFGGCVVRTSGSEMTQVEARVGVILRF